VICGDYLLIKRTLPTIESDALKGKTIVTNTLTPEDTQMLKDRGVKIIATGTPEYEGRYFATNVFEGVLITLLGKDPNGVTIQDYAALLEKLNWKPTITQL
jgi:hypothetical protein